MNSVAIVLLRVLLVVIAAGVLLAQVVIVPVLGGILADRSRLDVAALVYSIAAIAVGVCVEVALVAIWALLARVGRGAIFTERAFRWVDTIIGSGVVATAIVVGIGAHIVLVIEPRLDAPGLDLIVIAAVVASATFVLLMVVMRGLLRSATALQAELEEVV